MLSLSPDPGLRARIRRQTFLNTPIDLIEDSPLTRSFFVRTHSFTRSSTMAKKDHNKASFIGNLGRDPEMRVRHAA